MRWLLLFALVAFPALARDTTFDNLEGQLFPKLEVAGCPVDGGLSILDPKDKSTWTMIYAAPPTSQQRAACQQAINDFVFVPPK